jgi:hypothetical protein
MVEVAPVVATTKPVSTERWVARVHSPETVMPRKKLARRFEPRYGVSQSMIDVEAKWVERELADHLLLSTNELRKNLSDIQAKVASAEVGLREILSRLPDRERLALKGMLARDVFHIAALYETFIRGSQLVQGATGARQETPEEVDQKGNARRALVFREALFE